MFNTIDVDVTSDRSEHVHTGDTGG